LAETALGVAEVKLDRAQQEIAVLRGQIEDVENACEDWCRQANEQRERAEKVGAQALGEHDERIVAGVAKNLKSVATGDTDGSEYGGVVKGSG
jgi:hypothetical protein